MGTVAAGLICVLLQVGCASPAGRKAIPGRETCAVLDSLYRSSGFEKVIIMAGRATFDVEQYRVRGQFNLLAQANGDMGFEFSSGSLLGGQREDISISIVEGVIRVLDRERMKFYEREEVDVMLQDALDLDISAQEIVAIVLGALPPCNNLKNKKIHTSNSGEVVFSGRLADRQVRVVFDPEERRLRSLHWPVYFSTGEVDRLEASYLWAPSGSENQGLEEIVLLIEDRRWRIKLAAN